MIHVHHESVEALHHCTCRYSETVDDRTAYILNIAGGHRGKKSSRGSHPSNEKLQSGSGTDNFCSQFFVNSGLTQLKESQVVISYSLLRREGELVIVGEQY